jgi:hypothetical protein
MQLSFLGAKVRGREQEGDPFWFWLALQIRLIAGEHLNDDQLDTAVRVVAKAMAPGNSVTRQALWAITGMASEKPLLEHLARVCGEIEHCQADPSLYPLPAVAAPA